MKVLKHIDASHKTGEIENITVWSMEFHYALWNLKKIGFFTFLNDFQSI